MNTPKGLGRARTGILAAAACLTLAAAAAAADTTAAFLKIPVGARAASLGGAFNALSNDASAAFWNPAGLAGLGAREVSATDARMFADTRYDTLAYAHPVGWGSVPGTLGVSVGYLSYGRVEARDANRRPTGSYTASDMVVGLSYARPAFSGARVGGTLKMLRSQIADAGASGWAADVGAMFATGFDGLNLGLAAKNLGPGMTFLAERSRLPTTVSAGLAYQAGPLTLVGDVTRQLTENRTAVGVGMELPVLAAVSLRAGYAKSAASLSGAGLTGSGLGAGFGVRVFGSQLDYSFTPMGELGSAQRISLSGRF